MSHVSNDGHPAAHSLEGHRLLSSLPAKEQEALRPLLHHVPLAMRQVLYHFDDPIEQCYFPLHGVVSLMAGMSDGHMSEVGVVGCEGMLGISVVLGEERAAHETVVQVAPCDALRISPKDLRRTCQHHPALNQLLLRYVNSQLVMTAHASGCNALHPTEERLARWLLMVQDRVERESFAITHEYLSAMMGTRRATVTVIAGALERAGIIELRRGEIRILDRSKLEDSACECYERMRHSLNRVMDVHRNIE